MLEFVVKMCIFEEVNYTFLSSRKGPSKKQIRPTYHMFCNSCYLKLTIFVLASYSEIV